MVLLRNLILLLSLACALVGAQSNIGMAIHPIGLKDQKWRESFLKDERVAERRVYVKKSREKTGYFQKVLANSDERDKCLLEHYELTEKLDRKSRLDMYLAKNANACFVKKQAKRRMQKAAMIRSCMRLLIVQINESGMRCHQVVRQTCTNWLKKLEKKELHTLYELGNTYVENIRIVKSLTSEVLKSFNALVGWADYLKVPQEVKDYILNEVFLPFLVKDIVKMIDQIHNTDRCVSCAADLTEQEQLKTESTNLQKDIPEKIKEIKKLLDGDKNIKRIQALDGALEELTELDMIFRMQEVLVT